MYILWRERGKGDSIAISEHVSTNLRKSKLEVIYWKKKKKKFFVLIWMENFELHKSLYLLSRLDNA